MSRESGDIASAGRLLKRKILLALTLSSLVPLLVLAYVVYRYVRPDLHPADITKFYGLTPSSCSPSSPWWAAPTSSGTSGGPSRRSRSCSRESPSSPSSGAAATRSAP